MNSDSEPSGFSSFFLCPAASFPRRVRRLAEARATLEKAVALRPDIFGSNALLGATLHTLGEDEASYEVLVHAHALNPGDHETADLLFKEAMILAEREGTQPKYGLALAYPRQPGYVG